MKKQQILGYFDAPCDRCEGTGQYRHFGECFACKGTGTFTGGIVAYANAGFPFIRFQQISEKTGRPMKASLYMSATRLTELERFNVGMTVGGGWFKNHTHTDKPGDEVHVYGINSHDGEWHWTVAQHRGGFGSEPFDAIDFHLDVREQI